MCEHSCWYVMSILQGLLFPQSQAQVMIFTKCHSWRKSLQMCIYCLVSVALRALCSLSSLHSGAVPAECFLLVSCCICPRWASALDKQVLRSCPPLLVTVSSECGLVHCPGTSGLRLQKIHEAALCPASVVRSGAMLVLTLHAWEETGSSALRVKLNPCTDYRR